jgi:hypothetical protein
MPFYYDYVSFASYDYGMPNNHQAITTWNSFSRHKTSLDYSYGHAEDNEQKTLAFLFKILVERYLLGCGESDSKKFIDAIEAVLGCSSSNQEILSDFMNKTGMQRSQLGLFLRYFKAHSSAQFKTGHLNNLEDLDDNELFMTELDVIEKSFKTYNSHFKCLKTAFEMIL